MKIRVLTLNDGEKLGVTMCGEANGLLTVELASDGVDLTEVVAKFGNPEKTRHMTCDYGSEVIKSFDGFTKLTLAMIDSYSNRPTVSLKHP